MQSPESAQKRPISVRYKCVATKQPPVHANYSQLGPTGSYHDGLEIAGWDAGFQVGKEYIVTVQEVPSEE